MWIKVVQKLQRPPNPPKKNLALASLDPKTRSSKKPKKYQNNVKHTLNGGVFTHTHGGIAFSFVTPQSTPDSAAPATQQSQCVDPVGWAATAADAADGASLWRNSGDGFSTVFPRGFVKTKHQKNDTKITFTPKKIILSNYIHNLTEKQKNCSDNSDNFNRKFQNHFAESIYGAA